MVNMTQMLVKNAHHQMVEDHVDVLGHLHAVDGGMQRNVGELLQLSAVETGKADNLVASFFRVFHSVDDVLGIAAAGDRHYDIAVLDVAVQLKAEDLFETDVVGDRHHGGYVVVQAQEIEFLFGMFGNPFVKIVLEVRSRRGTSAVAEHENGIAVFHSLQQQIECVVNRIHIQTL